MSTSMNGADMIALTDHIADAMRAGILRRLATATEPTDAFLEIVRADVAYAATLAREGWHDPAETFDAILQEVTASRPALTQAVRGILTGEFADLGAPILVAAPSNDFMATARRRMSVASNGDRLAVFQSIALDCGARVASREIENYEAGDFLYELAVVSGVADELGPDDLQHVISDGLKGRSAIPQNLDVETVSETPRGPRPERTVPSAPKAGADHGQIPLVAELAAPEPYPIQAIGPVLARGAEAIARKIQAPVEMAAQSVLAVAALAAQAHADVQLPFGQTRPLSLALITVASSGDRKTSTDREAGWPLRTHEQELGSTYSHDLESYRIRAAVWEAEKKKIEGDKKATRDARKIMLEELGPAPLAPLFPFLTAPEPTIEGLIKAMPRAHASLGLFSAEGGQFVGGHGMSTDNRLKTASALSSLWDGDAIKRIRAGDGVSILKGRRLSLHMMIQPDVAAVFLTDPLLRDQGLLSRILVAAPCSMAGTRAYQETAAADEATIREYGGHILRLLSKPWPLLAGTDNELTPRVLLMSADAQMCWREFHDETERQIGAGGRLAPVRDFAGKAAEHAARVAGVLTIVANADAVEIAQHEMADAVELVRWHLGEALRLCAASLIDPATRLAIKLFDWLRATHPIDPFSLRKIVQFGPTELRNKLPAEAAVRKLVEHEFVREHSPRPLRWTLLPVVGGGA